MFAAETVRETYRLARPVPELLLSRLPVVTIASVTVDGSTLASTEYEADTEKGVLYRLDSRRRFLCWSADVIEVEYTAGFTLPGAVGRTLPEDVEKAAIALVKAAYFARTRDPLVKSESVEGVGSTAYWVGDAMPPDIAGLLSGYCLSALE